MLKRSTLFIAALLTLVATATAFAASPNDADVNGSRLLDRGEAFTFLFMTMGPIRLLPPFARMTAGRDASFRRRLAFSGVAIAGGAVFIAATAGVKTLEKWNLSTGSLLAAAGTILFLVALQGILAQYGSVSSPSAASAKADDAQDVASLAFAPLAFPTIVPPYGIAVVILLATLASRSASELTVLAQTVVLILLLDLGAMLIANVILKFSPLAFILGIFATVIAVLQTALGLQAAVQGIHLMLTS